MKLKTIAILPPLPLGHLRLRTARNLRLPPTRRSLRSSRFPCFSIANRIKSFFGYPYNGHLFCRRLWWHNICWIIILEEISTGISKACCKIDILWQYTQAVCKVRIPKVRGQTLMCPLPQRNSLLPSWSLSRISFRETRCQWSRAAPALWPLHLLARAYDIPGTACCRSTALCTRHGDCFTLGQLEFPRRHIYCFG